MVQANKGDGLSIDDLRRKHLRRKSVVMLLLIFGTLFSAAMTAWTYSQAIGLARDMPADLEQQPAEERTAQLTTATAAAVSSDTAPTTPIIKYEWLPMLQVAAVALVGLAVLLLGIGIRRERRSHSHSP